MERKRGGKRGGEREGNERQREKGGGVSYQEVFDDQL